MAFSAAGSWRRASGVTGSALAAFALLAATPAAAFWNDRIEVFASEAVNWDSNVFRLSDDTNAQAVTGRPGRSDRFHVHTLGATLDVPYSLQRFQAGYSWFATRYQRFDQLDFNGHAARANWLWAITPQLTGDLGYSDTTGLANFATFRTTEKDVVHTRQLTGLANWQVAPSWQLHANATGTERTHDDPIHRVNDIRTIATELRMSYVTAAENRIGVGIRRDEGERPEQILFAGLPFDNHYTQNGIGVVGRWILSGHSRLDGRVDYVRRRYEQLSERNYSGPSFKVSHTWTPTAKLTFISTAQREINPLDDIQTSFVLVTGVSVKPRWDVTEKIAVSGTVDYSRWQYRGDIASAGAPYEHRVRSAGVTVAWRPLTRVLVQAGVLREVRTSDLALADYTLNIATVEARIGF